MKTSIEEKYRGVVLEAMNDYLYKVSLELNQLKGGAMTNRRKELTRKQKLMEEIRSHLNASNPHI